MKGRRPIHACTIGSRVAKSQPHSIKSSCGRLGWTLQTGLEKKTRKSMIFPWYLQFGGFSSHVWLLDSNKAPTILGWVSPIHFWKKMGWEVTSKFRCFGAAPASSSSSLSAALRAVTFTGEQRFPPCCSNHHTTGRSRRQKMHECLKMF